MTLVGVLEVPDQVAEERLIQELVDKLSPNDYEFHLSPAFCVYMVCRYRLLPGNFAYERGIPTFVSSVIGRSYHVVHVRGIWILDIISYNT